MNPINSSLLLKVKPLKHHYRPELNEFLWHEFQLSSHGHQRASLTPRVVVCYWPLSTRRFQQVKSVRRTAANDFQFTHRADALHLTIELSRSMQIFTKFVRSGSSSNCFGPQ